MYLTFYNLNKEPFHITPDPDFLFLSPSHKESLASIIYGVFKRKGFVLITGEVGTGKTTVIRSFLKRSNRKNLKIVYLFNTQVTFYELLKTIFRELGIDNQDSNINDMIQSLHKFLINEYKKGNNVALIIDEAQNMPVETLENLRMLSNLETTKSKLLQIILVGQRELDEKLNLSNLRQLKQRFAIKSKILPMSPRQSFDYINHRLSCANSNVDLVFSKSAIKSIVKHCKGLPRLINILCDNALVAGYAEQIKPISHKIVKEVIRDYEAPQKLSFLKLKAACLFGLIFTVGILLADNHFGFITAKFKKQKDVGAQHAVHEGEARKESQNYYFGLTQRSTPTKYPFDCTFVSLPEKIQTKLEYEPSTGSVNQKINVENNLVSKEDDKNGTNQKIDEAEHSFPMIKTMEKGDYVTRMCLEIYGFTNDRLIEWIHRNNPQIHDIDHVLVGEKIFFPSLDNMANEL